MCSLLRAIEIELKGSKHSNKHDGHSHVFLCYDVANADSLTALETVWYPAVKKFCSRMPIITLVGLKSDLRKREVSCAVYSP